MNMKACCLWAILTSFLIAAATPALAVGVFDVPTELHRWNKQKAENGINLFESGGVLHVIDMEGYVLHQIKAPSGQFQLFANILENGNVIGFIDGAKDQISVNGGYDIAELDWKGKILWKVGDPRPNYQMHHDFRKIWNSKLGQYTVIFLSSKLVTAEDAIAAGGDPGLDYTKGKSYGLSGAYADAIVEMTLDGQVVWEWSFLDHTVQDDNPDWPRYGVVKNSPGKLDVGKLTDQQTSLSKAAGIDNDWTHCNSLDYNEDLDHIVVNSKHMSEFYVIDHGKTFVAGDPEQSVQNAAGPDGDFIYRFGKPSRYAQGTDPGFLNEGNQQIYGAHNVQWIKQASHKNGPELPGAGNFLIFSNGCYCPKDYHSEVFEINPYLKSDGTASPTYVNPPSAGYNVKTKDSKQIVWMFEDPLTFYSFYISSAQRMPNGNTLICSGARGHFFETTPDGEVVWEYFSPVVGERIITTVSQGNAGIYRVYRYGFDYPGLKGKKLSKKGKKTFTGKKPLSQTLGGAYKKIPEPRGFGYGGSTGGDGGGASGGTGGGGVGGY